MMKSHGPMIAVIAVLTAATAGCDRPTSSHEASATDGPAAVENADSEQPGPTGLQMYDETDGGIPVTARYPQGIQVSGMGSGEGVGVFFTFRPRGDALDDAEVHVFLPSGGTSAREVVPMITGPRGLIETNGWSLDGSRDDAVTEFPYPWLEMVFDISTDAKQSGHILVGQTEGQAVQVTLLYPTAMAEEYWPVAKPILDSLEFDPDLLPIPSSEH